MSHFRFYQTVISLTYSLHICLFCPFQGGAVLSPDPVKPNIGGSGLDGNVRRGKARIGFLVNRVTERSRQSRPRQITTPGKHTSQL